MSSANFNSEEMLSKMREISAEMQKFPNVLIMTTETLSRLRKAIEAQEEYCQIGAIPKPVEGFVGIPIEDYETVKECLDRMMKPRKGERLQLVLSGTIPLDCIDHPYMVLQVKKLMELYPTSVYMQSVD